MTLRKLFFLPIICLLIGTPVLTLGQKKEEIPQPAYEVEVIVTNIDVVVTDKKGNRVTGLNPENFEIYEDGVLQNITNFYEVRGMDVYASVHDRDKKDLVVPPKPLSKRTPQFSNKIIIFFDNWHLHPLNRNWSIKKLESFIRNNFSIANETNQGMIVCLDQKLEILQDFTSSQGALLQAMEEVKRRSNQSLFRRRIKEDLKKEVNRIVRETKRESRYEEYERALGYARNYVEAEQNDIQHSIKSMNAFIDYLTGIEGKKMLIYVCDGLPINPAEEFFSFLDQTFPLGTARTEVLNYDLSRLYRELTARCNANEIALYPINAQGLESAILSADKETGWNIYSRGSGMVKQGTRAKNEALQLMARETGGLAILNTNNIKSGLDHIKDDLQFYYSLGYVSSHREDNVYHSIQVRLVGVKEEYSIRLRHGYKRISFEDKIKESVFSRLYLKRQYNPMNIKVQILPLKTIPGTNKLCFTLKFLIPIKNLTLFFREKDYIGKIKLYIALMDSEGRVSPCHELSHQIIIPVQDYETALKRIYPYLAEMYVFPGDYIISLAVRDVPGEVLSFIQFERTIR